MRTMLIRSFVMAMLGALAAGTPVAAQDNYAQGFAGLIAGGGLQPGLVFGGEVGIGLTDKLAVYGLLGRSLDVLSSDELEAFRAECPACDITGDAKLTLFTVGARYGFEKRGTFKPYIAGGLGAGRLTIKVESQELGESLIDASATKALLEIGGGIEIPIGQRAQFDAGYRLTKLFLEDTSPFHRLYGAFGWRF